jgi:hypothetical protein
MSNEYSSEHQGGWKRWWLCIMMENTRTLAAVGLCVVVAVRASACPALSAVNSILKIITLGFNSGLRALVASACIDVCRSTPQQQQQQQQQVSQGQEGRAGAHPFRVCVQ